MNYSTFDINNFFIKKDSTLPELKYPLTQHTLEQYGITGEMLENIAITFSMIDSDTGLYRIANVAANLVINNDKASYPSEAQYTLTYKFRLKDTRKVGRYQAEFTIDMLGDEFCGKIKFPVNGQINIIISDSINIITCRYLFLSFI
jgi:hypothetical protein